MFRAKWLREKTNSPPFCKLKLLFTLSNLYNALSGHTHILYKSSAIVQIVQIVMERLMYNCMNEIQVNQRPPFPCNTLWAV